MKVAVIPDAAMMIVHLIGKNGHEYLSPTNLSEEKLRAKDPYDESTVDYDAPPYNMTEESTLVGNKYVSGEAPSGVKGRMSLYDNIITNAEAAVILGRPPKNYKKMYNTLNHLILFGSVSCINHHSLVVKLIKQKNIPILQVSFPTTRDEIIRIIGKVNCFLKNLDKIEPKLINDDNLDINLRKKQDKYSLNDFKKIIRDNSGV